MPWISIYKIQQSFVGLPRCLEHRRVFVSFAVQWRPKPSYLQHAFVTSLLLRVGAETMKKETSYPGSSFWRSYRARYERQNEEPGYEVVKKETLLGLIVAWRGEKNNTDPAGFWQAGKGGGARWRWGLGLGKVISCCRYCHTGVYPFTQCRMVHLPVLLSPLISLARDLLVLNDSIMQT
jgi:hypothetical protein